MRGSFTRRVAGIAITAIALVSLSVPGSQARPSLDGARAQLAALNDRLSLLDERYNQAVIQASATQARLGQLRRAADRADATLQSTRQQLSAGAAAAYIYGSDGVGSILGSQTFDQFTYRVEFLDTLTGRNADLAMRASVLGRRARSTARDLAGTLRSERDALASLAATRSEILSGIARERLLLRSLEAASVAPRNPPVVSRGAWRLLPASAAAQAALRAAYSVLGTPYQYGGADPQSGFDCSGLTMWSWAHAGVSLPHSAAAQYDAITHVPQSQLQPGDLVFFYSPIHHVGIYVGGGRMIDANHPGGSVAVRDVMWGDYVGAGRPGV